MNMLRRLFASGYLLFNEWQRTSIVCNNLHSLHRNESMQESYFYLSMAVWVASVFASDLSLFSHPHRNDQKRTNDLNIHVVITGFITVNALLFLSITSYVEYEFNVRLNNDVSLGLFFVLSVVMKFVRILCLQGGYS